MQETRQRERKVQSYFVALRCKKWHKTLFPINMKLAMVNIILLPSAFPFQSSVYIET